ncbi:DUF2516 family protein [Solicola sp. PLA-1-18]|uniref:DUF2516 family protein n=1 Tax=Solicola sp. PLA-1-18 TaxID=3380532 RepID=UPI003B7A1F6B
MDLFAVQSGFLLLVSLVLLGVKAFALVDAITRSPEQFVAADKQTKQLWMILLVIAAVAHLLFSSPLSILNLVGTVAALVYLADARPALKQVAGSR